MTTPCSAALATDTPCVHPAGDRHEGQCHDLNGRTWDRSESWFTPEAQATDDDDLEWL